MVANWSIFTTSSTTEELTEQGCCPPNDLARTGSHSIREGHVLCSGTRAQEVTSPNKFKPEPINKYDGSSNLEKFILVYHTVIEVAGGDDRVKTNYLPMTLFDATISWLVNLSEGTIYNWDQLCVMFIGNFHGTYEHP
jgi:hypothetical protein